MPSLAIIILTFNRRDALLGTLSRLRSQGVLAEGSATPCRVYIVDNGSTDGTREWLSEMVRGAGAGDVSDRNGQIRVVLEPKNDGVEGFNSGVRSAGSGPTATTQFLSDDDYVLILDDDAWPSRRGKYTFAPTEGAAIRLAAADDRESEPEADPGAGGGDRAGALGRALALLGARPELAAVTFMPVHPATGKSEWPHLDRARDDWPFMGCANLVRYRDWKAAGGYEKQFFLYRNDTDLALKLLAMGRGVHADPTLIAYHDSPAAARKSERWLHLATRNWCWMARRHGRGFSKCRGIALGCGWAVVQAGISARRVWQVLRGIGSGMFSGPPPLPPGVKPDGRAFASALDAQWRGRARR